MILNMIKCSLNCFIFVYVLLVCSRSASGYEEDRCKENGQNHSTRTKRIVGGTNAKPGSWPWQVSLQFEWADDNSNTSYHYCGGSILNSFWIVSASHCKPRADFKKMVVYAGLNHIGSYFLWVYNETVDRTNETLEDMNPFLQKLEIDQIFHWENATYVDGEIMLIKLKTPFEFNEHVLPVHLPEPGNPDYLVPGLMCFATGWGTIENRGRICPKTLQEIPFPLISLSTCKAWMNNVTEYQYTKLFNEWITSNMICAGYEEGGKSPCHADSGGPLVCCHKGRMELIGLTSWGINCAEPKNPVVFVSVPAFVDWINQTMGTN